MTANTKGKRAMILLTGITLTLCAVGFSWRTSAAAPLHVSIRFVPLQEWGFEELDGDGPDIVVIERKYGCIVVTSLHPR